MAHALAAGILGTIAAIFIGGVILKGLYYLDRRDVEKWKRSRLQP